MTEKKEKNAGTRPKRKNKKKETLHSIVCPVPESLFYSCVNTPPLRIVYKKDEVYEKKKKTEE